MCTRYPSPLWRPWRGKSAPVSRDGWCCPEASATLHFYGNTTKLQLPLKSLEEEFKVTRTREVLMYRDSSDPKVAQAGMAVKTGREWSAQTAVLEAELRLRHRDLVGMVDQRRTDLGMQEARHGLWSLEGKVYAHWSWQQRICGALTSQSPK